MRINDMELKPGDLVTIEITEEHLNNIKGGYGIATFNKDIVEVRTFKEKPLVKGKKP